MRSRLDDVIALLSRIAMAEPGVRGEPDYADDEVAAVITGLNMLAEELDHERSRRAEAEALLADERDAYDRSPAFLCSVDAATFHVLRVNHALARVLRREVLGVAVGELFAERDRTALDRVLRAALAGSSDVIPELAFATEPAIRVTTNVSVTDDGTRLRIVWRDVTRERQLEGQLLQAQKMHAVGRLSGGIAHDFNNILAIIMTSSTFIREALPEGSAILDDLALVEQASQRGAGMTSQLLAFSRQQVVRPQTVDVGALAREVERMLHRLISESVDLSLIVEEEDLATRIDPSQLTQVLINLVVNARDAIHDQGRILVEVSRTTLDAAYAEVHLGVVPGPYVLLSVTDDGDGMSPDVLAQIFEPFFTTKPVGEGTGLGLSVCYGVVEQAGGHIYAYSELDKGTTIRAYLPLAPGSPKQAADEEPVRAGHETILLVEDEPALRMLGARLLQGAGYRVMAFASGLEALEVLELRNATVDLVVTDVVMPRIGGRELAERMLRDGRTHRVLYLSGYTANSVVHNHTLEPSVAFLAKPFTSDQLLRAVRAALDQRV